MTFIDPLPHLIDMTDYALETEIAAEYPNAVLRDSRFPEIVACDMIAVVSRMLPRSAPAVFKQDVANLFRLVESYPVTWRMQLETQHRIGGSWGGKYADIMARLLPTIVEAVARRRMVEAIELFRVTSAACQAEEERRLPKPPKPRHFAAKFGARA